MRQNQKQELATGAPWERKNLEWAITPDRNLPQGGDGLACRANIPEAYQAAEMVIGLLLETTLLKRTVPWHDYDPSNIRVAIKHICNQFWPGMYISRGAIYKAFLAHDIDLIHTPSEAGEIHVDKASFLVHEDFFPLATQQVANMWEVDRDSEVGYNYVMASLRDNYSRVVNQANGAQPPTFPKNMPQGLVYLHRKQHLIACPTTTRPDESWWSQATAGLPADSNKASSQFAFDFCQEAIALFRDAGYIRRSPKFHQESRELRVILENFARTCGLPDRTYISKGTVYKALLACGFAVGSSPADTNYAGLVNFRVSSRLSKDISKLRIREVPAMRGILHTLVQKYGAKVR